MTSVPFALSFSAGKDSILTLHRLVQAGHRPVALVTSFHRELGRSWFHGVDRPLLDAIAASLRLPLILCPCDGETYHTALEAGLREAKELGAVACAFGDIDTEANRAWSQSRCEAVGLDALFPLWRQDRRKIVETFLDAGYRAKIKCIRTDCLDPSYLGRDLSFETLDDFAARGFDVCGENGEYHTLVWDGPLFGAPVPLRIGAKLDFGTHAAIDLTLGARLTIIFNGKRH